MQHNFIKEQIFERKTMTSKNTAKFKDYTLPKCTISGFFCQSNFALNNFSNNRVL